IRDPNPVIFLENEMLYGHSGEVPKLDDYVIPIGKARIVRSGGHVTMVSWSNGMTYALKAAEELAKEGIEAEVVDLRTLRPMDTDTIVASVKKTGRAVTVEEGWQQSGVGAEIAARIMEHAFDYLDAAGAGVSGKDVLMRRRVPIPRPKRWRVSLRCSKPKSRGRPTSATPRRDRSKDTDRDRGH